MGIPGVTLLAAFYASTILLLWRVARDRSQTLAAWPVALARGVVAGLVGFCLAAQFVTVEMLEPPYYIVILGVGIFKLGLDSPGLDSLGLDSPGPESPGLDSPEDEPAEAAEAT
jgi:hypothetical protein